MSVRALTIAGFLWATVPVAFGQTQLPLPPPPAASPAQTAPALSGTLQYVQPLAPEAIRLVQAKLHDAGAFGGTPDGNWSEDSAQALRTYQQAHDLQPTGEINQATAMMLGLDLVALLNAQAGTLQSANAQPATAQPPEPSQPQSPPAPQAGQTPAINVPWSPPPPAAGSDQAMGGAQGPTAQASRPHPPVPLSPDAVRALQARLGQEGFYHGAVDGVWGWGSQNALTQMQRARGLPVTGRIDAASVQALGFDPSQFANQ